MRCHSRVEFEVFSMISVKPSVPGGLLCLQYGHIILSLTVHVGLGGDICLDHMMYQVFFE
jgi:hypothetical protein